MRKPLLACLAGLPSQVQVQEVPSNPATGPQRCKRRPRQRFGRRGPGVRDEWLRDPPG